MPSNSPKPAFFLAVLVVVLSLVGFALWRFDVLPSSVSDVISPDELSGGAEAPDSTGITTAKEYNYVPAAKLPGVQGISSYSPMENRTVRFAINV